MSLENPSMGTTDKNDNEDTNIETKIEDVVIGTTEDDVQTSCGWFSCRPNWLQKFNTPVWLLVSLSMFATVQGLVVNGFVYVSLSTIEKRFDINSSETGLIASSYDIGAALLIVFVSYFGENGNKPRWLSIGAFIMGTGSFIFCLPHFLTGLYRYSTESFNEVCLLDSYNTTSNSDSDCETSRSGLSNYLYLFIFAQIFHGIGATPLYSLGTAFIDENVSVASSGMYIGIFLGFSLLGPALGYVIGAQFLTLYTDFMEVDDVTITQEDPGWVGAWWLGFILAWLLAYIFVVLPVGLFPKELPGAKKIRDERESQAHQDGGEEKASKPGFGVGIKDFPKALKILILNPVFMLVTVTSCSEGLIVAGFAAFAPKFVENQFGTTAGTAALLVGVTAVPGAGGGVLFGGYLIKKLQLRVKGMLKLCIIATFCCILVTPAFFMRCTLQPFAGVFTSYNQSSPQTPEEVGLSSPCNQNCGCTDSEFSPVCGSNNILYFDACHAGCLDESEDGETFYNCTCIEDSAAYAESKTCDVSCSLLPYFMVLFFLLMLFTFVLNVPRTALLMRCVADNQRSFSLGVSLLLVRCLGTIPGAILVGAAIDSTCLVWQDNCGEKGSCWVYDNLDMAIKMWAIGIGFKGISFFAFIGAHFIYKPPPAKQEEIKLVEDESRTEIHVRDKPKEGEDDQEMVNGYSNPCLDIKDDSSMISYNEDDSSMVYNEGGE